MKSTAKNQNGQGNRFAQKVKVKEAPHLGLHILAKDGSNVTVWRDALFAYAEANFQGVGRAFAQGARVVRTKPSLAAIAMEYPELEAPASQVMLQQEITALIKLKRKDEDDEASLFALIGQVTTDEGFARVKNLDAYAAIAAARDAASLYKLVVSEHTLQMHHASKREVLFYATERYLRIKQAPGQTDEDFVEKFKLARENMKTLGCGYKPPEADEAMQFLMGLDKVRHGEFVRDMLNRERADDGHGIPANVQGVVEAARKFICTPTRATSQASASLVYAASTTSPAAASGGDTKAVGASKGGGKGGKPCGNCKVVGHYARDCTQPCGQCQKTGHLLRDCPDLRKSARVMVAECDDDYYGEEEDDSADVYGYTMRVMKASGLEGRNKWLFTIDSYASESFVFCEELLSKCWDDETVVHGVHGPATVGRRGTLPGFGPAIVATAGGVNGLSLHQLEKRYEVVYNQGVSMVVIISEDCEIVFAHDDSAGCYSCVLTPAVLCKLKEIESRFNYVMVSTVAEREARYTKREVTRAAAAREMLRKMYHPSDASLIRTINHGVMTSCGVTGKDVVIATDIWGRDVASIQGKSKDLGPADDRRMFVPVMERKEQTVYCDVFHWRQVSFLLFVVKPLRLLMVHWLPKANLHHTVIAVNVLGNKLAGRGYSVTEIIVDPGRSLTMLEGKVPYRINTVDSRTHVADAEVEIKTIKERMRSTEARLPYKLPRRAVRFLANGVVGAYNTTLRAGETVSPRELFTGIKFDYARDMKFEFGQYVQATVIPQDSEKNGNKPRAVASIALCSTGNDRGGCWFMSLKKKTFFNALRGVVLPMPDVVIDLLNRYAEEEEGVKEALLEREVVALEPDAGADDSEPAVGMPTRREHVDPIVEAELGTVTNNHVTVEELLDGEQESAGPDPDEEASRLKDDNVYGLLGEVHDDAGEQEVSENICVTADAVEVSDCGPEPRRSERIAERMAAGKAHDGVYRAAMEKAVHIYRAKTARALGPDRVCDAKKTVRILRLTIKKAMAKNADATVTSVQKEFRQLIDKNVWTVLKKADLTREQLRGAIRSSMFLKEKYDAAGVFDKLKARLVAGGDGQDKTLYGDLSCPTVTQETVMIVLAIAAAEKRKIWTIDITGAYLECDLSDEIEVIMKLDPVLTKILQQVDKTVAGHQDEKGVTYVKLNKALYGTVQAALLWYKKLSGVLLKDGFLVNPYDACLFNKVVNGVQITVCFHVDDLLVSSVSVRLMENLLMCLNANFADLTVNKGNVHSYLAMNIVLGEVEMTADMTAYIEKCGDGKIFRRPATSPARDDLFNEPEDAKPLSAEDKAKFHSSVAQLLYLCKRTRVECLCAVNHLASRVAAPTEDDQNKLDRVLNYLHHTKDRKIVLKRGGAVSMEAFVDASFGAHMDGRSRTGIAIMMSGICVGAWSSKQKLNTKSSTEAEVVGLSDGLSPVIWIRELLLAQGYTLPPTKVHQDNQGVLSIMQLGRRPKHRTKHLNIRHFFARDRVASGDIELCYCPTREMIADVLTKAVNGELFHHLTRLLWNIGT